MKETLPDCDLIVGTEEEIMIASGADDVLGALKAIRALTTSDHRAEARRHGLHRL
jgi:5-dehydro-2-deoxygluconokinase